MEAKKAMPEDDNERFRNNRRTVTISRNFKRTTSFNTNNCIKGIDDIYRWYNKRISKSEERTITSVQKFTTSYNKIQSPENRPELSSVEKEITNKPQNPKLENSTTESHKCSTKLFEKNLRTGIDNVIVERKRTAYQEHIKGIDDIYEWYNKNITRSVEGTITSIQKCTTSHNKIQSPENGPELPSIEKVITQKPLETACLQNLKPEISTTELPKCFKKLFENDLRTRNSSRDLQGIDKIYNWHNKTSTKSEERNNTIEEKRTAFKKGIDFPGNVYEMLKQESLPLESSNTITFQNQNYKPQTWCRVSKEAVLKLIESYSIRNYPNEDYIDRLFKIETAFYDYLKLYVYKNRYLSNCSLFTFVWYVHELEPTLRIYIDNLSTDYKNWKKHKCALPTYGAAILSEDASHVVMVQSGTCKNSWGFPKGKVFRNEDAISCAIREVQEEIGFDIRDRIREDNYLECQNSNVGRIVRVYIIEGVPTNTKFTINCKYEIKAIAWQPIEELMIIGGKISINISCRYLIQDLKNAKNKIMLKKINKLSLY